MLVNNLIRTINHVFRALILSALFSVFSVYAQDDAILVDTSWLSKRLYDDDLVVVDTRSENEYLRSHILSAVSIPVMKTYNPVHPRDRVANLKYIRNLFRHAGIRSGQTIVIYDNSEYKDAGRVFWVFEVYGHKNVKLLNGGFALWQKEKLPTSSVATKTEVTDYVPTIEPDRLITRLDMRLAIEDDTKVIVDARPYDEFIGMKSESSYFGHIPHAKSYPADVNFEMVDGVKMLKPVSELKRIYGELGDSRKIYTYCNKGKDSSLTYALLRQLGYDTAHYDGSWFEWGNDATLPIERPQVLRQIK